MTSFHNNEGFNIMNDCGDINEKPAPSAGGLMIRHKVSGPRRLMKKGIALIFIGHINFIIGAIVHGTILRHISKLEDQVTIEYSVANIISVISGLLSIATGIIAILVSRNLLKVKLHWGLMLSSLLNSLTSLACSAGLILAIVLTVSQEGKNLISGCNSTMVPAVPSRSMTINNCPFDTTRIYDTTLALWIPSMVLSAVEGILSIHCFVVAMILRGIGPCGRSDMIDRIKEEDPAKGKKCRELETYKLITGSREIQL